MVSHLYFKLFYYNRKLIGHFLLEMRMIPDKPPECQESNELPANSDPKKRLDTSLLDDRIQGSTEMAHEKLFC